MSTNERPTEILLRAEIRSESGILVSYARELTFTSIFVVTDWLPPIDTEVDLRLSFPSLVDPLDVRARVADHRPAQGVGSPAGLAFRFEAPARNEIAKLLERVFPPLRSEAPRAALRTVRVLLVEDNTFIREMFAFGIAKYFQQRRGTVQLDHAADAADGRAKLAGTPYDLVIVDYYLPAEDGASFIASLRRDPKAARAAVVAISVGGRDAREATISAGADLFLDKPVVLRDLFRTLQVLSQTGALT